ncbi:MAG: tetratricopeptide repeat protein [Kordiimonas sp.]
MRVRASFLTSSFALLLTISPLVVTSTVNAQSSNAVNSARIDVLERKIRTLQSRMGIAPSADVDSTAEASPADRRLVADLSAKLGGVERQMRQLNGRLEEYEFKQRQLEQALDLLRKELSLQREDMLAAASNGSSSGVNSPVAGVGVSPAVVEPVEPEVVAPVVELPEGDAAAQYKYAFSFIQKNDLDSGRTAMEQFVAANAGDQLIGNAKFWLGRIHLQKGRNGQAAQQLFSLIEDHPNHPKRADALVDLADVLVKLDSGEDACNALAEFRRVEDSASPRLKKRAQQIGTTAKCG